MATIFDGLITSKMRIRILMRLFLNPAKEAYLRELSAEFGTSASQVKDELDKLQDSGLLSSNRKGRQVFFRANEEHPLFPELNSMVRKSLGMDRILDSIIERLGRLEQAILIDDYAEGRDTGLIDLVLVGDIDLAQLNDLVRKTEKYIERKIRPLVLTAAEYRSMEDTFADRPKLVLWQKQ